MVVFLVVFPAVLDPFRLNLLGKFLCFALVALGLDLLWGYAGIAESGPERVLRSRRVRFRHVPEAGVVRWQAAGLHELERARQPARVLEPFSSPVVALLAAILVPAAAGGGLGYLLSRSTRQRRVLRDHHPGAGVHRDDAVHRPAAVHRWHQRADQLRDDVWRAASTIPASRSNLYQVTVLVLGGHCLLSLWLAKSRFGACWWRCATTRSACASRATIPTLPRAAVFALVGGLAGLGGALFVPQVGIVNPDSLGIMLGIQMVIWVAVGGRGTLFGAVLGALVVNAAQTAVSESFPDLWQYGIGALFIAERAAVSWRAGRLVLQRRPRPTSRRTTP